MKKNLIILLIFVFGVCGCKNLLNVNVEVVSERTALENQVLGTYNALDHEMLLVASVRGVDSSGKIKTPPQQSQGQKDAITAIQTTEFYADDIANFKQLGWIGENNKGLIEPFAIESDSLSPELKAVAKRYQPGEFQAIVKQVNDARQTIMQRVIDTNENLAQKDLPQVMTIFAKLNAENAKTGEKIQTPQGDWIEKQTSQVSQQ